jgi:hypothetical protein
MATKKNNAKSLLAFSELWNKSRLKLEQAAEPTPKTQALRALQGNDFESAMSLCSMHPELLSAGSDSGSSMLNTALDQGKHSIAVALVLRGAWCGLSAQEKAASRAGSTYNAKEAPFEDSIQNMWRSLALRSHDVLVLDAFSAALASSGRPFPTPEQWVELAMESGKINLAVEFIDVHALPGQPVIGAMIEWSLAHNHRHASNPFMTAATLGDDPHARCAWRLIEDYKSSLSPTSIARLWESATLHNKIQSIDRLARMELWPPDWILSTGSTLEPAASALVMAAACSRSIFSCLRDIPDAVEAAKSQASAPKLLATCGPIELAVLSRLGVDIAVANSDGHTFLHLWAQENVLRDGWRTVCKARPDLLDTADHVGRTPRSLQRSRLSGSALNAFDAAIASIERSQLIKDAPQAATHPTAILSKRRL